MEAAGRHRHSANPLTGLRTPAVILVIIVLAAVATFGYRQITATNDSHSGCVDSFRLSVGVAAELVPAVQGAVGAWLRDRPTVGNRCILVEVAAAEPVDVAATIAAKANVALPGVAAAGGQVTVPNVWIPDSSLWLQRLSAAGQQLVPTSAPPIARTPVVLAMPQPVASTLGWPDAKVTWADLLRRLTTGPGLRAGIVEPTRDATGLAGLAAIGGAAQSIGGADAQQLTAAGFRALVVGRSTVRDDLLQRFPRSADATALATGISAAPLSEQAVNAYNAKAPPVPLAAVYAQPVPATLDYPFAVLPGLDADRSTAASRLATVLTGTSFRDRLAAVGLRAPDGSTGRDFPPVPGAPADGGQGGAAADPASSDRVLAVWSAMTAPARTLAVVDVSGSMQQPVPTAAGASRMAVTLDAARRGLALFDDTWSLGVWVFSTELDGPKDYKELVPIGPLAVQRPQILSTLGTIKPKPDGNTGLFDTILAGYHVLQDGWTAGMVNTMIVMTDGDNEDPSGLTKDQLLAELGKIKDAKRPVRILLITIGPDVAPGGLKAITDLTGAGSGVFAAPDPARISDIFLQAITTRAPQ